MFILVYTIGYIEYLLDFGKDWFLMYVLCDSAIFASLLSLVTE